jgi:N-acetyl-anhydromuramyl-L-alanine amidase AmpD
MKGFSKERNIHVKHYERQTDGSVHQIKGNSSHCLAHRTCNAADIVPQESQLHHASHIPASQPVHGYCVHTNVGGSLTPRI